MADLTVDQCTQAIKDQFDIIADGSKTSEERLAAVIQILQLKFN